ncbi:AfsR/SARP family transcriptional regulator [Kribbella deserti]|uniref:BTAD domain-containing putative transcriptional regulator n=1 Tax=Kribbella deserti TaxID=1926257 RepID=A0ABV6QMY5_9ACTN
MSLLAEVASRPQPLLLGSRAQVRLLGTVDVTVDGVPVEITGVRRKMVLAALAISAGQVVSSDLLMDVVWSGKAPATVMNTLQSHVSYLRRAIGVPGALSAASPGYRLNLGLESTDVQLAERLMAEAMDSPDLAVKAQRLQSAVELWRARPLADIRGTAWVEEQAARLERMRDQALKSLIDVRLTMGEHGALLPILEDLAGQNPFDEDVSGQLMLALYRAGRQADALAVFRQTRDRLANELGIDPGRRLRQLEQAILRQDRSLDIHPSADDRTDGDLAGFPVPAQLPPVAAGLVGRAAEITELDVVRTSVRPSGSVGVTPVVAITGMAGVGKSTLALSWAHRVAPEFPDGQLYVDLRGFSVVDDPMSPIEALLGLIESLGVSAQRGTSDIGTLTGRYRTLLAGKKVLVILDNAHNAEQIRPLLPSTTGCMVVVTSRSDLSALSVTNGAQQLRLRPLAVSESRALLDARLMGGQSTDRDAGDLDELLRCCGGLPLAIAIAASRWSSAGQRLAISRGSGQDGSRILDVLSDSDTSADLRSVFSGSYRWLSHEAAQLFRVLSTGDHAETSIGPPQRSGAPFNELARSNLLERNGDGAYSMHPLLRAYGQELAAATQQTAMSS